VNRFLHGCKVAFRVLKGAVLTVLIGAHLVFLLESNLQESFRRELYEFEPARKPLETLHEHGRRYMTATQLSQAWGMFSPNVGSYTSVSAVVLTWRDGTQTILRSPVEPPLRVRPEGGYRLGQNLSDEEREYEWMFHLGDGRIRKTESNMVREIGGHPGATSERWAWCRWRCIQYFRAHPERLKNLVRVELFKVGIDHDFGRPARLAGAMPLCVYRPEIDRHWPEGVKLPGRP
jgi:hypothetical protein